MTKNETILQNDVSNQSKCWPDKYSHTVW